MEHGYKFKVKECETFPINQKNKNKKDPSTTVIFLLNTYRNIILVKYLNLILKLTI